MTHHTHGAAAVAQPVQHVQDLLQSVLVQGPEPLVHEEGVDLRPTGLGGGHVPQPQCQGQRTEEGLAAREGRRIAFGPGPGVDHPHTEPARRTGASVSGGLVHRVPQLVTAVRHRRQTIVGGRHHLFQARREHVGGQTHAVGVVGGGTGGQRAQPLGHRVAAQDGFGAGQPVGQVGPQLRRPAGPIDETAPPGHRAVGGPFGRDRGGLQGDRVRCLLRLGGHQFGVRQAGPGRRPLVVEVADPGAQPPPFGLLQHGRADLGLIGERGLRHRLGHLGLGGTQFLGGPSPSVHRLGRLAQQLRLSGDPGDPFVQPRVPPPGPVQQGGQPFVFGGGALPAGDQFALPPIQFALA